MIDTQAMREYERLCVEAGNTRSVVRKTEEEKNLLDNAGKILADKLNERRTDDA